MINVIFSEAINGNWGNWTSLSDCSHSCGGGTQYRVRSCDNPGPAYGGFWCAGNDTDVQSCNMDPCPGKDCLLDTHLFVSFKKF